ncbi:CAMK protein kinase [Tremella mesenterica]|uniref:CAMK protein kinase n=1 Tax=Tremella mesenterica TaxID=5217 RepID=A0A4Q1BMU7_TREME|nr:CAMK protein kinase [Tremella mesenterica]
MYDLSKNGYILNGVHIDPANKVQVGEKVLLRRMIILRPGDTLQIPGTEPVFTYIHNHSRFGVKPPITRETPTSDVSHLRPVVFPKVLSPTLPSLDLGRWKIFNWPLGDGGFGTVYHTEHADIHLQVACKSLATNDMLPERINAEIRMMEKLDHPNVVKILDAFYEGKEQCQHLILELVCGGDLFGYIHEGLEHGKWISEDEVCFFAYQLFKALRHIHGRGIVHCDLKPENILIYTLCEYPRLLITDFGEATTFEDLRMTVPSNTSTQTVYRSSPQGGTFAYWPPEKIKRALRKTKLSGLTESVHGGLGERKTTLAKSWWNEEVKGDIWAIGVVLHYCVSAGHPYSLGDEPTAIPLQSRRSNNTFRTLHASPLVPSQQDQEKESLESVETEVNESFKFPQEADAEDLEQYRPPQKLTQQGRLQQVQKFDEAVREFMMKETTEWVPRGAWAGFSDSGKDFINSLLRNHRERISVSQAIQHPWLDEKSEDLKELYQQQVLRGAVNSAIRRGQSSS